MYYFAKKKSDFFRFKSRTARQRVRVLPLLCRFDFYRRAINNYQIDECKIACNLIANPEFNTIDAMIRRMNLIDELSNHFGEKPDIYDFLNENTEPIESKAAEEQMKEELEKVRKIRGENGEICETTIIEAENYAFFHSH